MSISYLLTVGPLQIKTMKFVLEESQCFEAAEAGLRYGAQKLSQIIQKNKTTNWDQPVPLGYIHYAGYQVELKVMRLPKSFCMMPSNKIGHYYELQACSQKPCSLPKVSLKKYIGVPDGPVCASNLTKRQEGVSAWCQL